ncbi:LysR family transcriptional regulator, partial [Brucella melitensis]
MHPDLLLAFVTVAETGSFTAAARALGTRQSTVSQQIKRLEASLGRSLFSRDT